MPKPVPITESISRTNCRRALSSPASRRRWRMRRPCSVSLKKMSLECNSAATCDSTEACVGVAPSGLAAATSAWPVSVLVVALLLLASPSVLASIARSLPPGALPRGLPPSLPGCSSLFCSPLQAVPPPAAEAAALSLSAPPPEVLLPALASPALLLAASAPLSPAALLLASLQSVASLLAFAGSSAAPSPLAALSLTELLVPLSELALSKNSLLQGTLTTAIVSSIRASTSSSLAKPKFRGFNSLP
mmetsp:Transcript_48468/g.90821  ORF Transcript_48468/g.90821 Transcript_48468/m.90821 type:complete len:247 (+) Transcript_48468:590-1330(+)